MGRRKESENRSNRCGVEVCDSVNGRDAVWLTDGKATQRNQWNAGLTEANRSQKKGGTNEGRKRFLYYKVRFVKGY
jgi:hypothetical protein